MRPLYSTRRADIVRALRHEEISSASPQVVPASSSDDQEKIINEVRVILSDEAEIAKLREVRHMGFGREDLAAIRGGLTETQKRLMGEIPSDEVANQGIIGLGRYIDENYSFGRPGSQRDRGQGYGSARRI